MHWIQIQIHMVSRNAEQQFWSTHPNGSNYFNRTIKHDSVTAFDHNKKYINCKISQNTKMPSKNVTAKSILKPMNSLILLAKGQQPTYNYGNLSS